MRQDPKVGAVATIRVWSRFWRQPKSAKKIRQKDTHFRFISGKEKDLFVSGTEKTAKMFNENFLHSIFNLDTYLGLREPDSPNLRMVSWNLNTESVAFRWWRTPFAYNLRIWLDQVIHPLKGPVFGRTGDSAGIISGITRRFLRQNRMCCKMFLVDLTGPSWHLQKLVIQLQVVCGTEMGRTWKQTNKKTTSAKCKTSI